MPPRPLLAIDDFALSFPGGGADGRINAVDGATLRVYPNQIVAVVGESGCGKSVTAMSTLGLLPSPPSRVERGTMRFAAEAGEIDLLRLTAHERRHVRGNQIAMIFQEPMTSLNPVLTIGDQLLETIRLHRGLSARQAEAVALEAIESVGIREPARALRSYPHEFSGGMRQRAMIAMALACRPSLLIADEPTTALDVTIQSQILDLIGRLRHERSMAVLLITHDLGVVAEQADVVCVMYAGRTVEYASTTELFSNPQHPYTRSLLASIPSLDRAQSTEEDLTTVASVVSDDSQWRRLATDHGVDPLALRPSWPTHKPPASIDADRRERLVEVAPAHWVRIWGTAEWSAVSQRFPESAPDIASIRKRGGSQQREAAGADA
ncbi:MAG: ABC transporter ATP-binding protein [Planctomycetota bacterium]